MKIKLSKSQWEFIGKRAGWINAESEGTKDPYDSAYYGAASNRDIPPEVLAEVLRRGKDDFISWFAAKNLNTPPEALAEVLRRGKDNKVSDLAARNPNIPPKAIIDWMRAKGKIGKEDPKI